jgi:hypothetical protein
MVDVGFDSGSGSTQITSTAGRQCLWTLKRILIVTADDEFFVRRIFEKARNFFEVVPQHSNGTFTQGLSLAGAAFRREGNNIL